MERATTEGELNPMTGKSVGITMRSVVIGVIGVTLLCLASPYQDLVYRNMIAGGHSAPLLSMLFFIMLVILNWLVRKISGKALSGYEMATIFCMLLVASGIPSMGLVDYLIPALVAPFYFADQANNWATHFHPHIPIWLVPSKDGNSEIILDFVRGGASVPWAAWIPCLAMWSTFLAAFYLATFSLCRLFSESWIHVERLSFPLVELPLASFEERTQPTWRGPVFWVGVLLPLFIYSWNSLPRYGVEVPAIPLSSNLRRVFGGNVGVFNAIVYPSLIGFFYFVPSTVSCSIWAFFLLMKFEQGIGAWCGTDLISRGGQWYGSSAELHQGMGAMMVLMAGWIWVARSSLAKQFKAALSRKDWAPWGALLGFGYMVSFWHAAGMSLWVGATYFLGFFVIGMALTRLVAQAGLPYVQSAFLPTHWVTTFAGSETLSLQNMSLLGLNFPMSFDMAGFMMPSVMNGLKVSDRTGISRRGILMVMALAVAVALPVSFYSFLTVTYEQGGSAKTSGWFFQGAPTLPFRTFSAMVKNPEGVDWHGVSFTAVGASVTGFLLFVTRRFSGWPIHPLGYMLAGSWVIQLSWFSCCLAWMVKGLILRFGGGQLYRSAAPFFLGLILGGFITPGLWALIAFFSGKLGHAVSTFPP